MADVDVPDAPVGGARVRARSSRKILDAAQWLVELDGIDGLSMRRLANEADVSVRTIYNLFGGKPEILRRVEQHFNEFGGEYANHFLAAVPEPTTLALPVMALLLSQRRRRAANRRVRRGA